MANDPSPLDLPPDGPLVLDSVELPAGRRIRAATDLSRFGRPEIDVLWMTENQLEDAGSKWWALHHQDLQPVLLDSLRNQSVVGDRRPWDSELVVWDAPVRGQATVADTLAELWMADQEDEVVTDWKLPYTAFPGLAPRQEEALSDIELELVTGSVPGAWLGLTAASRSADIPMTIGWFSCSDAFGGSLSPGVMTSVLRSWEDRFGALVFRLGWASIQLIVKRPPRSEQEALAVAAEFFGLADEFTTAHGATRSVREMAASITGSPWWRFWWD